VSSELRLDPILCDAYGQCAELLPELISLDEWGYPIIERRPLSPELHAAARRAVAFCPRMALALVAARTSSPARESRSPQDGSRGAERAPRPTSVPARRPRRA
jgi:ferredoxin